VGVCMFQFHYISLCAHIASSSDHIPPASSFLTSCVLSLFLTHIALLYYCAAAAVAAVSSRTQVKETFHKPLNAAMACDNRDSLAQNMYDNLFSWLVDNLNEKLASPIEVSP
jgi:hypothetical protein